MATWQEKKEELRQKMQSGLTRERKGAADYKDEDVREHKVKIAVLEQNVENLTQSVGQLVMAVRTLQQQVDRLEQLALSQAEIIKGIPSEK